MESKRDPLADFLHPRRELGRGQEHALGLRERLDVPFSAAGPSRGAKRSSKNWRSASQRRAPERSRPFRGGTGGKTCPASQRLRLHAPCDAGEGKQFLVHEALFRSKTFQIFSEFLVFPCATRRRSRSSFNNKFRRTRPIVETEDTILI